MPGVIVVTVLDSPLTVCRPPLLGAQAQHGTVQDGRQSPVFCPNPSAPVGANCRSKVTRIVILLRAGELPLIMQTSSSSPGK